MDVHVTVLARLVVDRDGSVRSIDVRLPDIPITGEIIELAGGTRCRVRSVVRAPAEGNSVSHYVYATMVAAVDVGD